MISKLDQSLQRITNALVRQQQFYEKFFEPEEVALLAAFIKRNKLNEDFLYLSPNATSYLETVDFYRIVFGKERVNCQRNVGKTYSPLVDLSHPENTDIATTQICDCISLCCPNCCYDVFDVIGELHDNVWSHGNSFGFSIAQKYKDKIIFAVVDTGLGFKKVLNNANIEDINSDIDAIEWCLQKGNTSTQSKIEDEWAQAMPSDMIDNPFKDTSISTKSQNENHHEGLGLFKLMDLVKKTNGYVEILSGDAVKIVSGPHEYDVSSKISWQGVAILCELNLSQLNQLMKQNSSSTDDIERILLGI